MGCYNHTGNFSKLPIRYGDRIVVLIGVIPEKREKDNFAPGDFTPISVPIRGQYDDYGGIENVERTPGIEVLEKFFGMNVEETVRCVERIDGGCENQIDIKKINELLKTLSYSEKFTLSYVMEHESIFEHLVSLEMFKTKDKYYWRIPHKYIESLGYTKTTIGKDGYYEVNEWKHTTLPTLKENCYIWPEDKFENLNETSHSLSELCEKIGCEVPEEYEQPYFESVFKKECAINNPEELKKLWVQHCKSMVGKTGVGGLVWTEEDVDRLIEHFDENPENLITLNEEDYSFVRYGLNTTGLFKSEYGHVFLGTFKEENGHLYLKYMKEVVELACLVEAIKKLEMSWGKTNYHRQDIDYNPHIDFHQKCADLAREKKKELEEY